MSDVFIAHVEEDADVALNIALGLEEAGYTTWSYEIDSIPGPSYLIQTGQAVEQTKAVIVIISPHSVGSNQVTKEVVRAHESRKQFVPVLRGITHVEFQNRQPEWREAMGAATSITIPLEGVTGILPRIISGLKILGILPRSKTDAARIVRIRRALDELQRTGIPEKVAAPPVSAGKLEPGAKSAEIPPPKTVEEVRVRPKWLRPVLVASAVIVVIIVVVFLISRTEEPPSLTAPPAAPEAQPPAPPPAPIVPERPLTLKYETFLSSNSRLAVENTFFFNEVARLSHGRIEMEYNYGVSHHPTTSPLLEAVGEGGIDCSLIPIAEIPHLIPLSQVFTFNYLTYNPDTLALAAGSLYNTYTPLREEWEVTNNVKVLHALPMDTLALCTTRPVWGLTDLGGLKICGSGPATDTLKRLGAEPVLVPTTEIYEALKQGKIDGALRTLEAIWVLRLFEEAEYLAEPWAGPDRMLVTVINKDVWDSLPADTKDLMENLSDRDRVLTPYLENIVRDNRKAIKEMVTAGVNFYLWPESEREIARKQVQPAQAQEWAEEIGTSGQELISRLQEELAFYVVQSTYKSGFAIWEEEYGTP